MQHHGEDFVGRVDHRDAAVGELRRQFRLEEQVQAIDRSIGQTLVDHRLVVGQADGAPGVRHRRIARNRIARLQLAQPRLDFVQVFQLALVKLLQRAGTHQPFGHGVAGEDQVVAAVAGHHLGFQRLAAVHHVVDDLDAGFPGEVGQGVRGEIVGPVVQAQDLFLGLGGELGTAQAEAQRDDQEFLHRVHVQAPWRCQWLCG
ncbi:hypothetical protein D3C81_1588330 [compost metagenome]